MSEINLDLIAYKLEQIALTQKTNQEAVDNKLNEINRKLAKLETLNENVSELKEWKEKRDRHVPINDFTELNLWKKEFDQLLSPKQLEKLLVDFEALKTFKTKSMMVWTVVQVLMALVIFWDKIFG
jgi:DNA polymerase I-like protein with 3'-5' exonuclease and polymerase domains|tara:strand:+ start:291 stop:668 length:378 start_codon:yes stop_codon:yes gene_type:complete